MLGYCARRKNDRGSQPETGASDELFGWCKRRSKDQDNKSEPLLREEDGFRRSVQHKGSSFLTESVSFRALSYQISKLPFHEKRLRAFWRPNRASETLAGYAELELVVKVNPHHIYDRSRFFGLELEVFVNDSPLPRDCFQGETDEGLEYTIPIHSPLSIVRVVVRTRGTSGYWDILGFVEVYVADLNPDDDEAGFAGFFELRKKDRLIGTALGRFNAHAAYRDSDCESGGVCAGEIFMKGDFRIKSGEKVDEWYAFCFRPPTFIHFEVGVNGQLNLERFYESIMQIVDLAWAKGLRKLIGIITVILSWRSYRLSAGLLTWYWLVQIWNWMFYPSLPLVLALAVYLLNNKKWSRIILAHEATASFDYEGLKDVASFNSSKRMASYVERVIMEHMKPSGQVDDCEGLKSFAELLVDAKGQLKINSFHHLEKLLGHSDNNDWISWNQETQELKEGDNENDADAEARKFEAPAAIRRVPPWLIPKGVKNNLMQWADDAANFVETLNLLHEYKDKVFVETANSGLFYVLMIVLSVVLFLVFGFIAAHPVNSCEGERHDSHHLFGYDATPDKLDVKYRGSVTQIKSGHIIIATLIMTWTLPPFRFVGTWIRARRQYAAARRRRDQGGCSKWAFYSERSRHDSTRELSISSSSLQ